MTAASVRAALRALLASDQCVYPASVFDPLSARVAGELGFEVAMFGGSTAALTVLGGPDLVLLTLSECAEQATRMCRVAELPIIADADHGYGNALNARRTIEELQRAGIAGLCIEDTVLPVVYGPSGAMQLHSIAEGEAKLRAALDARTDPGLVIFGRTSAMSVNGLDDTLRRVERYSQTGVDGLFLVGVNTTEALAAISRACDLPLVLAGATPPVDRATLARYRVRVCLQGHQTILAAVQAIHDCMKALREGTAPRDLRGLASADLMRRLTREGEFEQWSVDFLGRESK